MSRRSSRSRAPKKSSAALPAGVSRGLASLVEGNESIVASMLSVDHSGGGGDDEKEAEQQRARLVTSLSDCMAVNNLSAEAILARFFDAAVLRQYCEFRLGVSGKGNEATLAARIGRKWAKPDFEAIPLEEVVGGSTGPATTRDKKRGGSGSTKATKKKHKLGADHAAGSEVQAEAAREKPTAGQ